MTNKPSYKLPNFQFLEAVDPLLVEPGVRAEHYALDDPNTSMIKIRQLGDLLAQSAAAKFGIQTDSKSQEQNGLNDDLYRRRFLPTDVKVLFHAVRIEGNKAVHQQHSDKGRAITLLRHMRKIAVWYCRTDHNGNAKLGAFVPPVATINTNDEATKELDRLTEQYQQEATARRKLAEQAADDTELRKLAEEELIEAKKQMQAALDLAEETEEKVQAQRARYEALLAKQASKVELSKLQAEYLVGHGKSVAKEELTEADTRELIDRKSRAAGWVVDSQNLRYSTGVSPQKNRSMAIAEWPTSTGPADYVLLIDLMPVAVVEAKKSKFDDSSAITQARRYCWDYTDYMLAQLVCRQHSFNTHQRLQRSHEKS